MKRGEVLHQKEGWTYRTADASKENVGHLAIMTRSYLFTLPTSLPQIHAWTKLPGKRERVEIEL